MRFALRVFARQRRFALVTISIIALGIGLGAMVFALVDGVLFRPLPYRDPGRLVSVYGAARTEDQFAMSVSEPDLTDWRASARTLVALEGWRISMLGAARVRGGDESTLANCWEVSHGFFDLLGVQAWQGRTLGAADFKPGAPPAAVITYHLWKTALGGDRDVLGRMVTVGTTDYTIVGVLPRSFVFPRSPRFAADVTIPLVRGVRTSDRAARSLFLVGRLAQGTTRQQAQAELDGIALRLKPQFVGRPNLHPGAFDGVTIRDLRTDLAGSSHTLMWLVFGAATTVFLITCVNVVALLVAHNEERRTELAIRAAIGAGRWALVRQLAIEAALLAGAGAAVGLVLAMAAFSLVVRQVPQWLQLLGEPRLDARTAAFAGLLALAVVLVGGVMPALGASAEAPRRSLATRSRQTTTRHAGRHLLVAIEIAFATVLVLGGSIMMRSWIRLYSQETGLDADRLIAVRAVPRAPTAKATAASQNARIADAIRHVSGVTAVALLDMPPLQRAIRGSAFVPPRMVLHPAGMDTDVRITPDYFSTVGMRIVMGRGLESADKARAVVINESLARRYWPGANPVGFTIKYGDGAREIVGVVSDARDVSLDSVPVPTLFHVWDETDQPIATMLVRFAGQPGRTLADIRRAIRAADDGAAITMLSTVDDLLSVSVAERNFNTMLFGAFGVAALVVAFVGVYGLVSVVVARRAREMGIRLALGASGGRLKLFVVSATLRWVIAGLSCGLAGALLCAQYLRPFVFQVPPNDPATFAAVVMGFLVVTAVACYLPARRAARVDPMIALRAE